MVLRDDLVQYLARFLNVEKIKDACPNGLQVEGREEVRKIITSVSASEELFRKAAEKNADLILVHHGISWGNAPFVIRGSLRKRIKVLLDHEINLLGYHLPLDSHAELGNNALAARGLELSDIRPFGEYKGMLIGFQGTCPEKPSAGKFFERVNRFYGVNAQILPYGPEFITRVGIVSGGFQEGIADAVKAGLDLFITGEISESVVQIAREENVHFIAAGHYATERFGVRALGEHLAGQFDVETEYIDIPVPV